MKKGRVKEILLFFSVLSIITLSYASTEAKKINIKKTTQDNKSIGLNAKNHKWEFSISASFGLKVEPWIDDSLTSSLTLAVPARMGYYIGKNLEIEPEINFALETDPTKINSLFLGNLVYNFNISAKLAPFILGGVGIIILKEDSEIGFERSWIENYFVKNVGFGFKLLFTNKVALRTEYRFINYKDNSDNINFHMVFTGISIFL